MEENKVFFISGHRDITEKEFKDNYEKEIDHVLDNYCNPHFVIGDYYGADIMAQNYLVKLGFADSVTVYHMFVRPRNINPAIKSIVGGFKTDIERDSAMTKASDYDIAFVRDGKWDSGTAQNIQRRHKLN